MMLRALIILMAGLSLARSGLAQNRGEPSPKLIDLDAYPYVIGTQTIGATYGFTKDARLVETAQQILDLGSRTIKFAMGPGYAGYEGKGSHNIPAANPAIDSLTKLARDEPSHRRVLDMPFANYLIWTYCFSSGWWSKGFSDENALKEYREMYEFASYLLRTYNESGKTFYLGHWEGDWHLRPSFDAAEEPKPEAIAGMIAWLNIRQKAIDDAKRAVPHRGVQIYHYAEVNLVQPGLRGVPCVTTHVLPKTGVDFVSYSSYESLSGDIRGNLVRALSFIESKLLPKTGIAGRRAFIGEYGFAAQEHGPAKQDQLSRLVMRTGLEWGCRFVLYWGMYCNETKEGRHMGWWMIDQSNNKQPVYFTHQKFYNEARLFVAKYKRTLGRLPTLEEYRKWAGPMLDDLKAWEVER